MKNTLLLDTRVNEIIKRKSTICKCNPCTCSEKTKDQYFKEVKDALERANIENFESYSSRSVI